MTDIRRYADLYSSLGVLDAFSGDTGSGAFMLTGEDADGLAVLARLLAARLCGINGSAAFDEHADIMEYPKPENREAKKGKKADTAKASPIKVEDVEDIMGSLYLTPFELSKRVYIIRNAESMNDYCQNKLLKSLEEPPARVCFILCACGAMLPTVESRCIKVELPPFSLDVVRDRVRAEHKDRSESDVSLAVRFGRGYIGLTERMLADKDFIAAYGDAIKILSLATGSRAFSKVAAVYDKYTREKTGVVLGLLEYLLGDVARLLVGADTVFERKDINSVAVGFTAYSASACSEFVRAAQAQIRANCMPQAVLDGLVLKIMEEKALCQR